MVKNDEQLEKGLLKIDSSVDYNQLIRPLDLNNSQSIFTLDKNSLLWNIIRKKYLSNDYRLIRNPSLFGNEMMFMRKFRNFFMNLSDSDRKILLQRLKSLGYLSDNNDDVESLLMLGEISFQSGPFSENFLKKLRKKSGYLGIESNARKGQHRFLKGKNLPTFDSNESDQISIEEIPSSSSSSSDELIQQQNDAADGHSFDKDSKLGSNNHRPLCVILLKDLDRFLGLSDDNDVMYNLFTSIIFFQ